MQYKKYTVTQKLAAVAEARSTSISEASDKLGIDRKRIREWKENEEELRAAEPASFRLHGGGRTMKSDLHEELVMKYILEKRLNKERVTRSGIMETGKGLALNLGISLECTEGWLNKFFVRNGLVLRKATNKPVHSDEQILCRAKNFLTFVTRLIEEHSLDLHSIVGLDETALFFDHSKNTTVEREGAKDVQVKVVVLITDQIIRNGEASDYRFACCTG